MSPRAGKRVPPSTVAPVIDATWPAVFVARMFTIIGGDGKEYGPVTTDQVRTWINAGRANLETKAKALGSDEWRELRDYPEFSGATVPPLVATVSGNTAVTDPANAASRATRIAAALVNAFFYFLCTIPGSLMISQKFLERHPEFARGERPQLADLDLTIIAEGQPWVWAGVGAGIALQAILLAVRGQNLGKLMLGIQVVRADTGEPAGALRAALLRFLIPVSIILGLNYLALVLGYVFLLIDFCFIFREDGRCLHDLMAGTKVVRRR